VEGPDRERGATPTELPARESNRRSAEVPYGERWPAPVWLLWVALASAVLAGICIVTIDQPFARWMAQWQPGAAVDHVLTALEWAIGLPLVPWATAIILVVAMLVTVAVPRLRHEAPVWMFVAAVHITSRIAMSELKELTGRLRPLEWLKRGAPDETFLWIKGIAFPSGHVVLFASLVIPAIAIAPRAWPAAAIVVFVCAARVTASAHYLSDVLGAISLVALLSWVLGLAIRPRLPASPRR
jgi:membrane-associated phospholipid phosphatase